MAERHIAAYLRVSTKMQDTDSQEPDLKRWVEMQKGTVKWYRDKFTGMVMERPEFNKIMAAVREGKVSTIVVWRLDRLGRTAGKLMPLFDELLERKVNLVSIKDNLDFMTATGRLMVNMLASFAQFETEVRRERVAAGLAAAKDKGVTLGRKKDHKHTRIKVELEQIKFALELRARKESVASIARTTALSQRTIYRILKDPTFEGKEITI